MFRALLSLSLIAGFAGDASAAVWDGGGANNNWSTPANWVGDVAPAPGDDLEFPSGASRLNNTNDVISTYRRIVISAGGYVLHGADTTLTESLAATYSTGSSSVFFDLVIPSPLTVSSATGGLLTLGNMELSSTVTFTGGGAFDLFYVSTTTGTGSIRMNGTGILNIYGNTPITGGITINSGTVLVHEDRRNGLSRPDIRLMNGTLMGSGVVGVLLANGGRIVPGGGRAPSDVSGDRTLSTFAATLNSGSTFVSTLLVIQPPFNLPTIFTAPSLVVTGPVTISGATLQLNAATSVIPSGRSIVLIDNDGTDPVIGTFAGLPGGTRFVVGSQVFVIHYAGGDGNDVVIIADEPVAIPMFGPLALTILALMLAVVAVRMVR